MRKHKIVVIKPKNKDYKCLSLSKPQFIIIGSRNNGRIFDYEILIGVYKLSINIFHMNYKSPKIKTAKEIGQGGGGTTFKISINKNRIDVCKRVNFKKQFTFTYTNSNGDE